MLDIVANGFNVLTESVPSGAARPDEYPEEGGEGEKEFGSIIHVLNTQPFSENRQWGEHPIGIIH